MKAARCPTWSLACATAYRLRKCRCETCRGWNAGRERRRVLNLRMKALDALTEEFIQAVRADTHYVIDMTKAFWTFGHAKQGE